MRRVPQSSRYRMLDLSRAKPNPEHSCHEHPLPLLAAPLRPVALFISYFEGISNITIRTRRRDSRCSETGNGMKPLCAEWEDRLESDYGRLTLLYRYSAFWRYRRRTLTVVPLFFLCCLIIIYSTSWSQRFNYEEISTNPN